MEPVGQPSINIERHRVVVDCSDRSFLKRHRVFGQVVEKSLAERSGLHEQAALILCPIVLEEDRWMHGERGKLSRHADVAKAMDYMLKRWVAFARFLDDGRICLTNNAAERELRRVALGRKIMAVRGLRPRRGARRCHCIR